MYGHECCVPHFILEWNIETYTLQSMVEMLKYANTVETRYL